MKQEVAAFTPKDALVVLYGHSLVSGSAERKALMAISRPANTTIWISLDSLVGSGGPPQDVFWLRLGEPGLMGHSWRQILSQAAKLVPAIQALGATAIHPLSKESTPAARIAAFLLGLSCQKKPVTTRPNWLSRLPALVLGFFSPGRAKRFKAQHSDSGGQLAALINAPSYSENACHIAAGINPVAHYLAAGQYAGINPNPLFWTLWYARQHLLDGGINATPWQHFIEIGRQAGLNPNPFLVTQWYDRQQNAGRHHTNPLLDLVAHALNDTLAPDPNPLFDGKWYADRNECGPLTPLEHFIVNGARQPTCPFLARHPELGVKSENGINYAVPFTKAFASSPSCFPEYRMAPQDATGEYSAAGRIAVCCVHIGDYDTPHSIGALNPNFDYFLISDRVPVSAAIGWQVIRVNAEGQSSLKLSRSIKMNLERYLPKICQYKTVVYLDGNIELVGDLAPLIHGFLHSGADLGVVPHPYRQCVYEEAAAVMLQLRDSREKVMQTVEFLESQGHPPNAGLFEMNLFCFRPRPVAYGFFHLWWDLYQLYGDRDQLLAPLVASKQAVTLYSLLPNGESVRTHPVFRYHPHRSNSNIPRNVPTDDSISGKRRK